MSGYPQSGNMPPGSVPQPPPGIPQSPSQLGVRPAPALVQQLLVGAFGWMFAGLLLTAAVAFLVSGNQSMIDTVGHYWWLIAIGQFALAIGIQGAINRISPTASLGLFFVYAASMGFTIAFIVSYYTSESRRVGVLLGGGDVRGGGGLRRRSPSASCRAWAGCCSWP